MADEPGTQTKVEVGEHVQITRTLADGQIVEVAAPRESSLRERGFESPYDVEIVELTLWEIVVKGGNCQAAWDSLAKQFGAEKIPSVNTMRKWRRGTYRNRYHEIAQGRARDVEERVAQRAMDLAIQQTDLEEQATQVVARQVESLPAVEASLVLRNVAQAKGLNLDKAAALRGRSAGQLQAKSLSQIAAALERLGVAEVISDAEVVEGAQAAIGTGSA